MGSWKDVKVFGRVGVLSCIFLWTRLATADDTKFSAETLKSLAVDLQVAASALESRQGGAVAPALPVYLSVATHNLKVISATLAIDDGTFVSSKFSDDDATGFATGGLAEIGRINTPTIGAHRIEARVGYLEGKEQTPITITYSGEITSTPAATSLELQLDQTLVFGASLKATVWSPADAAARSIIPDLLHLIGDDAHTFEFASAADPQVRAAEFLRGSRHAFDALGVLLQGPMPADADEPHAAWWRELAESATQFGALARAGEVLDRLAQGNSKPSTLAAPRIHLAEALYRRGRYDEASAQLQQAKQSDVPSASELDWLDAAAQIALAQADYAQASQLLLGAKHELRYADYVRYFNLGAALIHAGEGEKGATVLDRVGRLRSGVPLQLVLRDEANLELGYYFLREQQGRTALPILNRISQKGPQATRALLGIGWAWLALPGGKQHRTELGDEREQGIPPESRGLHLPNPNDQNLYQRYKISPFEQAQIPDAESARLKRAVAAWSELSAGNHEDPAVQEGLAALALALDRLGAHEDASRALQQAVDVMEQTRQGVIEAQKTIGDNQWIDAITKPYLNAEPGSDWIEADLPALNVSIYLQALFAGNRFQQALHDCRDLELLHLRLQDWDRRMAGFEQTDATIALRGEIATHLPEFASAEADEKSQLRALVIEDLQRQLDRNEILLASARFRLARKFDKALD